MNEPVPFVPTPETPPAKQFSQQVESLLPGEAQEKARYRSVKAKALEDPRIQQLHDRADNAATNAEEQTASTEYYRALFDKMREIEPSLKERIDRMEAATLRRLERNKAVK